MTKDQNEIIFNSYAGSIYILKLHGLATTTTNGGIMIEWLVNRIFRWDTLRHAVFDEVMFYQSVDRSLWENDKYGPTNLTWAEGDTWYGWTYNSNAKRYYFDDIGNQSLMGLWEDQWLREADENESRRTDA